LYKKNYRAFCTKKIIGHTAHLQQVHNKSTTRTTSPQLVVQQIHNKSYKWSLGLNKQIIRYAWAA